PQSELLRAAVEDCMFCHGMDQGDDQRDVQLIRPNRDKAASKATRAVVVLLLLASIGLLLIVTIGGWAKLAGMQPVDLAYILVYLIMAYYVARWNRGVLPMAAALAIICAIRPGGGIGIHDGLKSHCPSGHAGSSPAPGTPRRAPQAAVTTRSRPSRLAA